MLEAMERWFLLDNGPAPGPVNMAIDEMLLSRAEAGAGPPVLRIYSFDPPTITIGFHQDPARAVDLDAARRGGIDVVRRFTGGRALLHDGELTYAVVGRTDRPPFDDHLQETYLRISGALAAALRMLGVPATLTPGRSEGSPGPDAPPCLDSASRHEIAVSGKKIIASAQRRTGSALLQHGSILLDQSSARIVDFVNGYRGSIEERITSIERETGRVPARHEIVRAIVEAFEETFHARFEAPPESFAEPHEALRMWRERRNLPQGGIGRRC